MGVGQKHSHDFLVDVSNDRAGGRVDRKEVWCEWLTDQLVIETYGWTYEVQEDKIALRFEHITLVLPLLSFEQPFLQRSADTTLPTSTCTYHGLASLLAIILPFLHQTSERP